MKSVFRAADTSVIRARAEQARDSLRACRLCELQCGVNRLAGERGRCGLLEDSYTFKRHISFAEEIDLLPSYMVYFGGCNFRCRFCVQAPQCFSPSNGVRVAAGAAATDFRSLIARGAKTINLLGGEPSLHLHTILEIAAEAAEAGERLPLILNSNMYMTPEVIELLEGVVPIYIADFKFGSDACARQLAGIDRYLEVVTRNLLHASRAARVIVRHLLMPGHIDCCLRPVAGWMAEHLPGHTFTLMTGYVPGWRAGRDAGPLARYLTDAERQLAEDIVTSHGLVTEAAPTAEVFA